MKKQELTKNKLSIEKFQISSLSNLQIVKGGGDWTIMDKSEEEEQK